MPSAAPAPSAALADPARSKHAQLSDQLVRLATEELGPGSAIPSERELMTTYGVSRATVRRAIDSLVVSGLLHRVPARGTFVAVPRLQTAVHLASFSRDMRRRGLTPSTRLIAVDQERPAAEIAAALALGPDETTWRVHRVRLADGEALAEEVGWYPCALAPGLDLEDLTGSLYDLLATRYDRRIARAEQTLWTEPADADVARRLGVDDGSPVLAFTRVSFAERPADEPVEYSVSRYRGDRYQLHMTLEAD